MIEDGRLGRATRSGVVVTRDDVEELRAESGVEVVSASLDQTKAEVDVTEQRSLRRGEKKGAAAELDGAAGVVEESGGEEEVSAEPAVELARLATERGDADRVLEEAAAVAMVAVRRRRELAQARAEASVRKEARDDVAQAGVEELAGEEIEEPVELVEVLPRFRNESGRIGVDRLEGANVELEAVAEALDAREHAHRVSFLEAAVEELDVVPNAPLDAAARVDELEREVGASRARPQAAFARHGVHPLDDAVLGELADRGSGRRGGHVGSLGRKTDAAPRARRSSSTDLGEPPLG